MDYRGCMDKSISNADRVTGALYGLFVGDALAMPVHWYYDTKALRRDYGLVRDYLTPRNPHPDSILWRSSYRPPGPSADILHDQARYWGQKGIHYHQFLKAGENTLNGKLAGQLLEFLSSQTSYAARRWLERMVSFLTTPGNHKDTYVEEYLRHFFSNYGRGVDLLECGRLDEHHIGGMTLMLPLVIHLSDQPEAAAKSGLEHLGLTHGGNLMQQWGAMLIDIILPVFQGTSLRDAIAASWRKHQREEPVFFNLFDYPDEVVVTRHFSSACYIEQALPATLYLAAKYQGRPEDGLIANTMCGGDNCGRGSVLGALLGASSGWAAWPERWRSGLVDPPRIQPNLTGK